MKSLRIFSFLLLNAVIITCLGKDIKVESFTERADDLSANTYAVLDFNNKKCALIKISIPDNAAFEGNVVKVEYKTNEYYVYLSPGTKKIVLKYPGFETLEIQLSDYLDGSGVESGRTYRLKVNDDFYDNIPQLTINLPSDNNGMNTGQTVISDSLQNNLTGVTAQNYVDNQFNALNRDDYNLTEGHNANFENPVSKKKKSYKFSMTPQVSFSMGNVIQTESTLPSQNKSSSISYGIEFGFNLWEDIHNEFTLNFGGMYTSINLNLDLASFSYNYYTWGEADEDHNPYYRYYDINSLHQEITATYIQIPLYFGYKYKIKEWLNVYANVGGTVGFRLKLDNYKLKSVSGNGYAYGIYPEFGDLRIDEPYINGFGNFSIDNDVSTVNVNIGDLAYGSFLFGFGAEARIYGPLWFNLGFRYNKGFANLFRANDLHAASAPEGPLTYNIGYGEIVTPLTNYFMKSTLNSFSLILGIVFKL